MPIVWEWGSELDLLIRNCERYASSAWKQGTAECAIALHGIERNEGVTYSVTAYTRNRTDVAYTAARLLDAVLGTKVRYCSVEFTAEAFPKGRGASYREDELLGKVELLLGEVSRKLLEKDENLRKRVEQTGKRLMVDWLLWLSCVARSSEMVYIVECHDTFLDVVLPFMKKLALKLGDVDGYTLRDRVEDPVAIDIKEDEEHLHVTAVERSRLVK